MGKNCTGRGCMGSLHAAIIMSAKRIMHIEKEKRSKCTGTPAWLAHCSLAKIEAEIRERCTQGGCTEIREQCTEGTQKL